MTVASADNPQFAVNSAIAGMHNDDLGWMGSQYKSGLKSAIRSGDPTTMERWTAATADFINRNPAVAPYIAKYNSQVMGEESKYMFIDKMTMKSSVTGGVNIGLKGKGAMGTFGMNTGTEGSTTYDLSSVNSHARNAHNRLLQLNSALSDQTVYQSKSQGFRTDLTEAAFDDGNWPYVPVYGLLYDIEERLGVPTDLQNDRREP